MFIGHAERCTTARRDALVCHTKYAPCSLFSGDAFKAALSTSSSLMNYPWRAATAVLDVCMQALPRPHHYTVHTSGARTASVHTRACSTIPPRRGLALPCTKSDGGSLLVIVALFLQGGLRCARDCMPTWCTRSEVTASHLWQNQTSAALREVYRIAATEYPLVQAE